MIHDSTIIKIDKKLEDFFDKSDRQIDRESKAWMNYLKKYAERDWMELLNQIYWYNIILCTKINEESIDWEDINKSLWIQISNRIDKPKFRNTIKAFPPSEKTYLSKLIFLVLTYNSRWTTYKTWIDLNNTYFNCSYNIISLYKLHQDIISITDIKKIFDIINTLYLMFPNEFSDLIDELKRILLKYNDLQKIRDSVGGLKSETF